MREVIMPALGMAQSTGVIVSWLKKVGDTVAADDMLMEVETDKTTMEVPAGHDGVVLEIRAEAGSEVPVGEVIALIGAAGSAPPPKPALDAKPDDAPEATAKAAAAPHPAAPATPPAPVAAPASASAPAAAADPGKVLASPKARLMAATMGIDLSPHAARSQARPILAADVEAMAAAPRVAAAAPAAAVAARPAILTATAPAAGWRSFLDWMTGEAGVAAPGVAVAAAFAAAAFRAASGGREHVVVAAESLSPDGASLVLADPDRSGLASPAAAADTGAADLTVLDLTGTALSGAEGLGAGTGPMVVLAASGDSLTVSLSFDPSALAPRAAAAMLTDIVRRIENPLRHLL